MSAVSPARGPGFPRRAAAFLKGVLTSIRFRLALWTVFILALILVVYSVIIYTRQAADLEIRAQAQLQYNTSQMEVFYRMYGLFDSETADHAATLPALNAPGGAMLPQYETMALMQSDGKVLQKAGSIDDATAARLFQTWQSGSKSAGAEAYTAPLAGARYVFLVTPIMVDHHWTGLIVLGRPVDPDGQLTRLALTLLLGSFVTLAIALAGGYWLAGRAMSPVRAITRTARGISESDLGRRLRLSKPDELGELADTFDAMLDRLEAAFSRQRQFTADASHELRTPLTIVGLEADQALQKRRSPDEYERALRVIRSENEVMTHMVSDLLTLARMDAGQTRLRFEPLDLSDLALDVVERLTSLAGRSGVELNLGDLPEAPVQGDRQYLSQALSNLVENAIKYAGGRGKRVQIETGARSSPAGERVWVSVRDDGPGIPPEHLPHLFDRFYRVDEARSRGEDGSDASLGEAGPNGSGLGLSIVQWIVTAHGGSVEARSRPGEGAAFEIDLPRAPA